MKFAKLFVVLAVFSLTFAAVHSTAALAQEGSDAPSEPTKPAEPKPAEPK